MKNIHVLPTENPSNLTVRTKTNELLYSYKLFSSKNGSDINVNQHIYITSDEEIKEGDWGLSKLNEIILFGRSYNEKFYKKIILTTDVDLIADGVQAIDNEFLEWFVKNATCEVVDVVKEMYIPQSNGKISDGKITHELSLNPSDNTLPFYKIIIPKEEPKQEPLAFPPFDKEKADVITKEGQKVIRELRSNIQQETLEEAAYSLSAEKFEPKHIGFMLGVIEGAKWQAERMYSEKEVYDLLRQFPNEEELDLWFEQNKKK
jgi:hypothetical protein